MAIIINHDGDTWRIVGIGTRRDGKVYCHLASTTRSRKQRNGDNPIQIADWIDEAVIDAGRAGALVTENRRLREALITLLDANDIWLGEARPDLELAKEKARAALAQEEV